ncbi:MAG TPA: UDP-N-acetylmuramoyl-tripeptide--D-alanyl-D-alanine ligase [Thermoanaerobaculia bacterium]|nr:UDP-N-acetylmuramoyl-tripeptide--D-alanyl-D-alanine ligase [Thermoanaerobaculia bacterium]
MRGSVEAATLAMGGRVVAGDGAARWSGAAIDSRRLAGGELFFALPGEHTDGHRYVAAAAAMGAAACVVHHDLDPPAGTALIRVDDTAEALRELARALRRGTEGRPPRPAAIAAITGSTGKTTTKELAAAMLSRRYRTARSEGNLNNLLGFPLSLLNAPDDTEWLVAEMGMSAAGELARLTALARPELVIYTNVRPVHLEFFDSVRAIAEAKAELLEGLVPGGLVVANADDPEVSRFVERFAAARTAAGEPVRVVWYGRRDPRAAVRATDVAAAGGGEVGTRFTLTVVADGDGGSAQTVAPEAGTVEVRLPLHGDYNVDNALAAAAAAVALGVPLGDLAAAAVAIRAVSGRGAIHRLAGGVTIVDDSYNSNPEALKLALDSAAGLPGERRWAVLGDMLELGPEEAAFHRAAGRHAVERGFVPVYAVGELSREIAAGAAEAGGAGRWFATAEEAVGAVVDEIAEGDVLLVKASRGVGLDRIVERLLAATPVGAGGAEGDAGGEA